MPDLPVSLVSLKSYGDYIIARWALQKFVSADSNTSLLIGDHLCELDNALGSFPRTYTISHGEQGVPSIFDFKRVGLRRGVSSALRIRRRIFELNLPENTLLIFDRKGIRETFLASNYTSCSLPSAINIYSAYEKLFHTQDSGDFSCTSFLRNSSIKYVEIETINAHIYPLPERNS